MKSALPVETACPFCKTDLKAGATVCAACGASYAVQKVNPLVGMGFLFLGLLFMTGLLYVYMGAGAGWVFMAVGGAGIWLIVKTIKPVWATK